MAQGQSKFPSKMARFFDTREAGSITVQCVELDTNSEGFVEAPANFAPDMEPHGFLLEGSPAYIEWAKSRPRQAQRK